MVEHELSLSCPLAGLRLLLCGLFGERSLIPPLRRTDGLLEDELADTHPGIEDDGIRSEVEHFQLDLPLEARVDGWCRNVNANSETGEATFSLNPCSQP